MQLHTGNDSAHFSKGQANPIKWCIDRWYYQRPFLTHLDVKHSDKVGPLRVVFDQTAHSAASLHPAAAPVWAVDLDHRWAQCLNTQGTRLTQSILPAICSKTTSTVRNKIKFSLAVYLKIKLHQCLVYAKADILTHSDTLTHSNIFNTAHWYKKKAKT